MPSSSSSDEVDEAVVVSTDDEADSQCQYCRKYYSEDKHGEKWVHCTQCYVWCHEKMCRGREKKRFRLLNLSSVNDDLPQ
jgi:Pyruvate/2-oxoacid:ferredoxin oxidoreductase delta subunit